MNREIKFRAWDKDYGMKHFEDLNFLSAGNNYSHLLFGGSGRKQSLEWEEMPYTNSFFGELMLYTGLKDKNGKEIYEGDIVRFEYDPNEFENYKISWGTATFYAESLEDNEYSNSLWDMPRENMEVIGNVYENPELLNNNLTKTQ